MPYSDPQSTSNPTTGQPILAAWGDVIRDDLEYLARNFPHCSIYESTAQSIPNNTWTALTSNEERSDVGGLHSVSVNTSRITVPAGEGGLYLPHGTINFAGAAGGTRNVGFGLNGANPTITVASQLGSASIAPSIHAALPMVLAAGDYIQLMVLQDFGSALNCIMLDFSIAWQAVA